MLLKISNSEGWHWSINWDKQNPVSSILVKNVSFQKIGKMLRSVFTNIDVAEDIILWDISDSVCNIKTKKSIDLLESHFHYYKSETIKSWIK